MRTSIGLLIVLLLLPPSQGAAQSQSTGSKNAGIVEKQVAALLDDATRAGRQDAQRFRDFTYRAERLARSSLAAGHPLLLKCWFFCGVVEADGQRPEKALAWFEAVTKATTDADQNNVWNRHDALRMIAQLHLANTPGQQAPPPAWKNAAAGIDAVVALFRHGVHWKARHPETLQIAKLAVQHLGWRWFADTANQAAVRGSPAEAAEQLAAQLDDFQRRLIAAGGQQDWCSLGWLWYCELLNRTHLPQSAKRLDALGLAMEQRSIEVEYRSRYWNLRGQWSDEQMDYQQAFQCHAKALELQQQNEHWKLATDRALFEAQTRNNLGLLHLRLGDVERAAQLFEAAEQLYRQANCYSDPDVVQKWPDALTTQINLAEARKRGRQPADYQAAQDLLQAVLERLEQPAENSSVTDASLHVLSHNNLGLLHYECGRFDQAEEHFQVARRRAEEIFTADSLRVAEIDVNRGWLALANENPAEARRLFSQSLETFRSRCGLRHPRTAECMAYLARVLASQGGQGEARKLLEEALAARERSLTDVMSSAISERDRLAFVQELRAHHESVGWPGVLDTYLELASRLQIPAAQQYQHVLAWKGILGRFVPARPSELESEESIQQLAERRESVLAQIRSYAPAKAYRFLQEYEQTLDDDQSDELAALEQHAEQLSRELAARSQRFRSRWHPQPPQLAEVQTRLGDETLPAGTLLLDLIQTQRHRPQAAGELAAPADHYTGFVVHPRRGVARVDFDPAGEKPPLADQIDNFYAAVADLRNEQWREPGNTLAATLRAPLEPHLTGISRLLVVSDGWFHLLPWGALPGRKADSLWSEEVITATIPSVDSLLHQPPEMPSSASEQALVIGDIEFGDRAPERVFFRKLSATAAEVDAVVRRLRDWKGVQGVTSLTGDEATEQSLSALLPRQRLLHVATHGYFVAEEGGGTSFAVHGLRARLDSALVLAGANAPQPVGQPDQLLTAEEIGRLDLQRTDLVVLSACETGRGHFAEGQGLIGLLGAFHQAGAGAVVSSLWKVPDDATQLLMAEFYQRLLAQKALDPAEAICAVQQEMARGALVVDGEKVDHPFYWAAWSVSGIPRQRSSR